MAVLPALFAAPPSTAGTAVLGPPDAPVNVVIFSDFQCPFCASTAGPLRKLVDLFPDKIRIVFRHSPLSIHKNAPLAHNAALAAAEQGKFWEMHDLLFADQSHLDRGSLLARAEKLGLDMTRFTADLDSGRWEPALSEDMAEAKALGVNATPTIFINGKTLVGAQTAATLARVVNQALGSTEPVPEEVTPPPPGQLTPVTLNLGNAPVWGPADAPVTIVAFSDFQCPFCARSVATLHQIRSAYPDSVRIAFKNFPLNIHRDAPLAAQAGLAAAAQNKFWEMHDRLFANQKTLKREDLPQIARAAGLDVQRFESDLDSGKFRTAVESDITEGQSLGVDGTPVFFVNGRRLAGASPFTDFDAMIRHELSQPRLTVETAAKDKLSADPALTLGPATAPVSIVWFSDLTCDDSEGRRDHTGAA